jgi:hypothetical protein
MFLLQQLHDTSLFFCFLSYQMEPPFRMSSNFRRRIISCCCSTSLSIDKNDTIMLHLPIEHSLIFRPKHLYDSCLSLSSHCAMLSTHTTRCQTSICSRFSIIQYLRTMLSNRIKLTWRLGYNKYY